MEKGELILSGDEPLNGIQSQVVNPNNTHTCNAKQTQPVIKYMCIIIVIKYVCIIIIKE